MVRGRGIDRINLHGKGMLVPAGIASSEKAGKVFDGDPDEVVPRLRSVDLQGKAVESSPVGMGQADHGTGARTDGVELLRSSGRGLQRAQLLQH